MRVIHLARKPLNLGTVVANTLDHGTGPINIDGSRIAAPGEAIETHAQGHAAANGRVTIGSAWQGMGTHQTAGQKLGRWPSNLILRHLDGCRCTAVRRSGVHADAGGHQAVGRVQPVRGFSDADGMEEIAAWECVEGCPVAALDASAGPLKSGVGAVKRQTGSDRQGNSGPAYGQESRPAGTPMISYGDSGGASRFYKHVGGQTK